MKKAPSCPECKRPMLIKETLDGNLKEPVKIAVCNYFRDCGFDEEIKVEEKTIIDTMDKKKGTRRSVILQ